MDNFFLQSSFFIRTLESFVIDGNLYVIFCTSHIILHNI